MALNKKKFLKKGLRKSNESKTIAIKKHPYTFARVSAMRANLIETSDYHKMLKMTIAEITEFIQDYGYKKAIDELSVNFSGVDLIERAVNKDYIETILKLKRISHEEVDILINSYINRWDFLNIKTILRGIHSKHNHDYIASLLIPVGNLDYDCLQSLIKMNNVEEVLKNMRIVDFNKIANALQLFKKTNQLGEIENAIDKIYYQQLQELSNSIKAGGEIFKDFLETSIDVLNMRLILKLKKANIPKQEIKKYIFEGGKHFNSLLIEKLINADFSDVIKIFQGTPYKRYFDIKAEDIKAEDSLVDIELELDRLLIEKSFVSWHKHPLSALAILGYMLAKEAEVRNIKTIARAKQLGLKEEFIEEKLLVI